MFKIIENQPKLYFSTTIAYQCYSLLLVLIGYLNIQLEICQEQANESIYLTLFQIETIMFLFLIVCLVKSGILKTIFVEIFTGELKLKDCYYMLFCLGFLISIFILILYLVITKSNFIWFNKYVFSNNYILYPGLFFLFFSSFNLVFEYRTAIELLKKRAYIMFISFGESIGLGLIFFALRAYFIEGSFLISLFLSYNILFLVNEIRIYKGLEY
jgi:hypothetical protein